MRPMPKYLAWLTFVVWVTNTLGAQNNVTLSVSLREEYNDNFRLTAAPHSRVFATTLSPAARFTYATDTLSASGKAQLNFNRYNGDSQLNNNDLLLDGSVKKNFALDQLSLLTSYVRDSTLASELAQTGVVQANRQRTRFSLNPEWTGTISPRASWTAGYDFSNVGYQSAGSSDLVDYRVHRAYSSFGYRLTERTKAFASAGINQLKFDGQNSKTRTIFSLAGIEHDFSEVWRAEVSAGLRRVTLPGADGNANKTGWLAQSSLDRKFETGALKFAAGRELNPTGLGALTQTDKLSIGWSDKITPTVTYDLSAAAYRNAFISTIAATNNDHYYRIDAHIGYALTENWIVDGGLAYAQVDPDLGSAAKSRSAFFSARYEWDKQLPGR
jgi:hypothetical protein